VSRVAAAICGALLVLALAAGVVGRMHNVPTAPTRADVWAVHEILRGTGHGGLRLVGGGTFESQIRLIQAVQDAVLSIAPRNRGIPLGGRREPADLLRAGHGLCYDRSRSIEKALAAARLPVRHVSVYSTRETGSALVSLLTPGVPSHALSEVRTRRGWLVVGSNRRWISLRAGGVPVSMAQLARAAGREALHWSDRVRVPPDPILRAPFTYVYGLYSRHGRFYPPMDPVPDVNWADFMDNFVH